VHERIETRTYVLLGLFGCLARPQPQSANVWLMDVQERGATSLGELRASVRTEVGKVVIGYENAVDLLLTAAVAGGHVLIEGAPGVAKTILAGSMAQVLGVSFKRMQFTPDTQPMHLTGSTISVMGEPKFVKGPIFTNLLLADEINRTPTRVQAALLEAMQERHITHEGRTHWLPNPFMVIATQNPYEHSGVYELPESQLDRFLFKIRISYLDAEQELAIVRLPHRGLAPDVLGEVQPLLDVARLDRVQREMDSTHVPDDTARYAVRIARATRTHPAVTLGVGPRGIIHLVTAAKAAARLAGRDKAERDDVTAMAVNVLAHRLILRDDASPDAVVADAVASAA
jgi:MoxR-like ATPase